MSSKHWIQTATKRQFFYDSPEEYAFSVVEIAGALSKLCRFAGHVPEFYSVAQHSVLVAETVRADAPFDWTSKRRAHVCRAALLHDAAEAFCVDVPAPLKWMGDMVGYGKILNRVELAIEQRFRFELMTEERELIHDADMRLLATEKRDLLGPGPNDDAWQSLPEPIATKIAPLAPDAAALLFLRHWELYGGSL